MRLWIINRIRRIIFLHYSNFTFHSGAQPALLCFCLFFWFLFPSASAVVVNLGSIQRFLFYFEGSPLCLVLLLTRRLCSSPAPFLVPLIRCTCVLCLPSSASFCAPSCCFIPLLGFQPEPMSSTSLALCLWFFLIPSRLCLSCTFRTCLRVSEECPPSDHQLLLMNRLWVWCRLATRTWLTETTMSHQSSCFSFIHLLTHAFIGFFFNS